MTYVSAIATVIYYFHACWGWPDVEAAADAEHRQAARMIEVGRDGRILQIGINRILAREGFDDGGAKVMQCRG